MYNTALLYPYTTELVHNRNNSNPFLGATGKKPLLWPIFLSIFHQYNSFLYCGVSVPWHSLSIQQITT
jgi:hypothetical protein